MSTALLQELNEELRRIYIAGSELATGDFRLKRMVPQFQQLGERAPVFKKLGEGIQALIEPDSEYTVESAKLLQDLNVLLLSVLHTQGTTSVGGELTVIRNQPIHLQAHLSYRKLSAVRSALTTRGGGRYEIIKEAYQEGMFQDLRLLPLAIEALNDPYVEIADFAMTDILPSYGSEIVPYLQEIFDPSGGKGESRKLKVIAKNGGNEVLELIFESAGSGSDEVRTTAIRLLAGHDTYETAVLDWSRDKKKGIREAAYDALAASDWESAVDRLYEASTGKDCELVNPALARCHSVVLTEHLVQDLAKELQSLHEVSNDKMKIEDSWTKVKRYLWALHHKENLSLEVLYREVLEQYERYMYNLGWTFLVSEATLYMKKIDSEEVRKLLTDNVELDLKISVNSSSYANEVFVKAQTILTPSRLYEEYVSLLLEGFEASAVSRVAKRRKQLLETIEDLVIVRKYRVYEQVWAYNEENAYTYHVEMLPESMMLNSWDSRWLQHFIDQDVLALVSAFSRPGDEQAEKYLLGKLQTSPEFRNRFANLTVMGLVRAETRADVLHEALIQAMEDERNIECHEIEPYLFEQLCQLPANYAERIQAVLPKFLNRAEEQLRYILRKM